MFEVVKMVFGSHLYGTATPWSDKDYKGVFFPWWKDVVLQRVPRSIRESTKPHSDSKNTPKDVETEMYSLHYFIHLACEGETVALDMLHAPSKFWITHTETWKDLVKNREKFYTKSLKAFVGYARRQAAKYGVKGSRLSEAKTVLEFLKAQSPSTRVSDVWDSLPRGEHIHKSKNDVDHLYEVCGKKLNSRSYCLHHVPMLEAFVNRYGERARQAEQNEGVDWKAVSHAFRAAYQVEHILRHGGYTYPLPETEWLCKVKGGTLHFTTEVAPKLDTLMTQLEELSAASTLPEKVDRTYWDQWLYDTLTS